MDAYGKKDRAAALLWHRTILDDAPAHKPSLRWVEQALITDGGREEELEPLFDAIARALDGSTGGEVTGHAQHAARFAHRRDASATKEMVGLASKQPEPSLWSLRAENAQARQRKDEEAILSTTLQLLERTQRPAERAALLLRASEAASRLERVDEARSHLEQAANEDPGDVVTWGFLAEVRQRANDTRAAAEACESLARASVVRSHQLLAWSDAAKIWLDEARDADKGMAALEQASEIDVGYGDVFTRLSTLYAEKRLDAELARLLEKRLAQCNDEGERAVLEVDLARALSEMGEIVRAKKALTSALEQRPDHTTALSAMAELCVKEGDWNGAEQAYVRLARLLATPEEQSSVYDKLGDIYAGPALNLSRAEVAYKEVLKRTPKDATALSKLVDVYKRQGDVSRAVETQQIIVGEATDPSERLQRLVELSTIYEAVGHDARRAEQVLDSARKEFPTSVVALRAMAEFYARQRQMPAMQILLDRAAGDARRSFAAGRFVPALFEVLHAAYELRGKKDAARVVAATLAAVEGQAAQLRGADAHAIDPRLDDVLAPEIVSASLRTLMYSVGDALDAASPMDLRAVAAAPLGPGSPIGPAVGAVATVVGLGALQILVSPKLGKAVIPLSSNPPTVLVGEEIGRVKNTRARTFLVVRAIKMVLARASALLRNKPEEVGALATGLFMALNPSYQPSGVDINKVRDWGRRIHPALPRNLDPTVGVIALEAAGMLGPQVQSLGAGAIAWANRAALLAIGDPNGALDAIAWMNGLEAAPTGSEERAAWIARTPEARDLMTFSVTDHYAEARTRLGLDR
jgi:tetratricopeptide (TPR) repeat protein